MTAEVSPEEGCGASRAGAEAVGARPRLLVAVTHPMTARLLMRGQLAFLKSRGFEVAVAAAGGPELEAVRVREGVAVFPVPFSRSISPLGDLRALALLLRAMRSFRPAIVSAGTPKAGLLGMIAARLAGVAVRVYTVRGLRLETMEGRRRALLARAERTASRLAHRVVLVGESLRRRYLELGLAAPHQTTVLGCGSSNGVDVERFHPSLREAPEIAPLRQRLGIPSGAPVVGFVGRFTRDKGIADLAEAFCGPVAQRFPSARLVLVGDFEEGDPVPEAVRRRLDGHPRVVRPGFVADSALYYGLMDVLAFPSFREGFPNAPLEASAAGIPVVGYAVTGTVDAVASGETGTLVPAGDAEALARGLGEYLGAPELRREHGAAGRSRVERFFRQERVWQGWEAEYRRLLEERLGSAAAEHPPGRREAASPAAGATTGKGASAP